MHSADTATFILTRRCAAACPGCPVEIQNTDMSPAVLSLAAARLAVAFPRVRRVKLFGGEPLLTFPLVLKALALLGAGGITSFELGTNGRLLNAARVNLLRRLPQVQVNVNAAVSIRKIFLGLPNMIWNLCVVPENPFLAVSRLRRLAALARNKKLRVNLLPAYYREWSPGQLRELGAAARELGAIGPVPLFNSGPAVDTDGRWYSTNLCLARLPARLRQRFLLGGSCGELKPAFAPVRKKDLVEVFGLRAVASTYAADRVMGDYA
jgi:hypothetical protein